MKLPFSSARIKYVMTLNSILNIAKNERIPHAVKKAYCALNSLKDVISLNVKPTIFDIPTGS